jgi:ribosome modulation factor
METTQQFLTRIALEYAAKKGYPESLTGKSETQTPDNHIDTDIAESQSSPDAIADDVIEDEI